SVIHTSNIEGIRAAVSQQFAVGQFIFDAGLIPILEPEVDINSPSKAEIEEIMKAEILKHLDNLDGDTKVMLKLTIPSNDNSFKQLIEHERVIRVVALSGGYSREEANEKLSDNTGLIASFSRALTEGLSAKQTDDEFDEILARSIDGIYKASIL